MDLERPGAGPVSRASQMMRAPYLPSTILKDRRTLDARASQDHTIIRASNCWAASRNKSPTYAVMGVLTSAAPHFHHIYTEHFYTEHFVRRSTWIFDLDVRKTSTNALLY
jgi:hypothetical protein